jgi:putative chitinase
MPIHPKFGAAVKALAAKNADPAVIKDILDSEDGLAKFGIDTPLKAAHFLAQTSHESGGFRIAIENMNYSAKRLMEVFGKKRFPTIAKAQEYAGNQQKIGNFVYASRMGNGPPASGDGFRFRGRGIIQMTGRDMYRQVGEITELDLEVHPELAEHAESAIEIAGAIWKIKKCDTFPESAPVERYTKAINGGAVGLPDRKKRFATAKSAMGI